MRIPICGSKDARVTYRSKKLTLVGLRAVSVMATAPVFAPSRSVCPASRSSGKTRLGTDVAVPQRDLVAERVRARAVVHRVEVDRHRY